MKNQQLNTRPLEALLQQAAACRQSGQSEMRISRKQAQDLEHSIAILLLYITEAQERVIQIQDKLLDSQSIDIEFDGGDFDSS